MSFVHRLIRIVVEPLLRHISSRPVIRKQAVGLINEPWRSISIRTSSDSDFFREWRVVGMRRVSTPLDWFRTSSTPIEARSRRDRITCQVSGRPIAPLTLQFMPGLGKKIALLEGRSRADLQPIPILASRVVFDPSLLPPNFSARLVEGEGRSRSDRARQWWIADGNYVGEAKASWLSTLEALVSEDWESGGKQGRIRISFSTGLRNFI